MTKTFRATPTAPFACATARSKATFVHELPLLPRFGCPLPLPLGGGEGWGEGAARRFKGAMRVQSSEDSLSKEVSGGFGPSPFQPCLSLRQIPPRPSAPS